MTGLGQRPVALLLVLLRQKGEVVSKRALIDAAWPDVVVEESNLPVQIAALRHQFSGDSGEDTWIETVPRRGDRFVGPAVALAPSHDHTGGQTDAAAAALQDDPTSRDQPSIAMLAFENLAGGAEYEYFGDEVAGNIITTLTRFKWFSVAARKSSFAFKGSRLDIRQISSQLGVRYILEGSHHQIGGRIRITAQSVDAAIGHHIWAERYEWDVVHMFATRDETADRVAGAIEPELLRSEARRSTVRHAEDLPIRDLIRKGIRLFRQVTRETHEQARELFRLAAVRDPQSPEAHFWVARVSGGMALWGWCDDLGRILEEGLTAALVAVQLDEKNPYAHYAPAIVSCPAGHLEQAVRAAERAIALSPSFALGHLVLGMAKLYSGFACEAREALRRGISLSAYDPHGFAWFDVLALAHLFDDEVQEAVTAATEALKTRPASRLTLETMAICLTVAGRIMEAHDCLRAMPSSVADPNNVFAPLMARNPGWCDRMPRLFRKAEESD